MPQWKVTIHSYTSSDFCAEIVCVRANRDENTCACLSNVCNLLHTMHLFFFLLNICIPTRLVWCRKLWLPKPTALCAIGWLPLMMEIAPVATTPQSKFDTQDAVFTYWVCLLVSVIFKHAWVDFNRLLLKLGVLRKSCNLNFYFACCTKCTFLC